MTEDDENMIRFLIIVLMVFAAPMAISVLTDLIVFTVYIVMSLAQDWTDEPEE